jgi:hypothetical protein
MSNSKAKLAKDFKHDMYQLYIDTWKDHGSRGERFRQMIEPPKPGRSGKNYRGAVQTAKYLMTKSATGRVGLEWLAERDALHLSVESLVVKKKYRDLFFRR